MSTANFEINQPVTLGTKPDSTIASKLNPMISEIPFIGFTPRHTPFPYTDSLPDMGPRANLLHRDVPRPISDRGKPYSRTMRPTTVNGHFRQFTPRILMNNVAGISCWEKAEGLARFMESKCFHPDIFRFYYDKMTPVMKDLRDTYRIPLIELERMFLRFLPYTRSRQFARTLQYGAFPFDSNSEENRRDMIRLSRFFLGSEPTEFDINGYIRHCGGAEYLDWGKPQALERSASPVYDPFLPASPDPFNPFDDDASSGYSSMPSLVTISDSSLSDIEAEASLYVNIGDTAEEEYKKQLDQLPINVDALPNLPSRADDPGASIPLRYPTTVPGLTVTSPTPSVAELPTELKQLYVAGPHVVIAQGPLNAYSLLRENMRTEANRLVYDGITDTYHMRIRTVSSSCLNSLHSNNTWDCPQNTVGTMHLEKDPISGTNNTFFVFRPGPQIFPRSLSLCDIPIGEKPFFHPSQLDPEDRCM